jgi:hypothetical protein
MVEDRVCAFIAERFLVCPKKPYWYLFFNPTQRRASSFDSREGGFGVSVGSSSRLRLTSVLVEVVVLIVEEEPVD